MYLVELLQEVQWLWDNAGGDRLSAKSFWIGRDDTPSCCLEAFALECAAFHCPESFLGAEYWVREGGESYCVFLLKCFQALANYYYLCFSVLRTKFDILHHNI